MTRTAETSSLSVLTNIFAAPAEAFAAIKARPRAWLPLLVLIAGYCAISLTYMSSVDLPWFMERQMQNAAMTAAQREQAVEAASRVSPLVYGGIGAVSSTLFLLLWFTVISLYYTGVSFLTSDGVKFKQWFGLVVWCTLPVALGLIASLAACRRRCGAGSVRAHRGRRHAVLAGLAGLVIGYGLGTLAASFIPNFPPAHTPWWAVALALGFSALVGVVFGILPAAKAANLDPISSLRYE